MSALNYLVAIVEAVTLQVVVVANYTVATVW